MDNGFDSEDWLFYCKEQTQSTEITERERKLMFVILQDFVARLWQTIEPKIGGGI